MKKRDVFLLLIIILLIGGFILLILRQNFVVPEEEVVVPEEEQEIAEDPSVEDESEREVEEEIEKEPQEVEPTLALQRSLENRARFFIERYNTFSSDNEEENLYSLLSQVSDSFAPQIENLIEESSNQENKNFYALQTKVLSMERVDFVEEEKAIFRAQVQEIEEKEGYVENFYKEAELEFVYEEGDWKVNNLSIR